MVYSFNKSLGNLSQMVSKRLGSSLEQELNASGIDLNAEQWSIISLLYQTPGLNQNGISQVFGIDKVRVLRILVKLEQLKLIERSIQKTDKRANTIKLTDKGLKIYKQVTPLAELILQKAFNSFSRNEIETYMKLTQRIINNLD